MSSELVINDEILLMSTLGEQYKGTITNINNDIITIKFETIEKVFFVDSSMNIMFNDEDRYNFKKINKDSDGVFKFTVEPNDILTNKVLASSLVWQYLDLDVPSCNCPSCMRNQITTLESALLNVPADNQIANILALHIRENMLPRLRTTMSSQTDIMRTFLSLFGYNIESDDDLNDLLDRTFNDRNNERSSSSLELINKVKNLIKPYDSTSHKHKECCLCLEDISNTDNHRLIVSCPKCEQVFCAGNDDIQCGGFFKHMGEDHRCPCCRTKIKDWFNNQSDTVETTQNTNNTKSE